IELGCDDISVKRLPDTELNVEELKASLELVNNASNIGVGLERHGIEPSKYILLRNEENVFPSAKITVRELDGTLSETYTYSDIEEAAVIEAAEERLDKNTVVAEISAEVAESTEPTRQEMNPAIDIVTIHEAKPCEELAAKLKEHGLEVSHLYGGDEELYEVSTSSETVEEPTTANSLYSLFDEIKKIGRQGLQIQRYKGLGEMNAEQLWETTMEPTQRKMIQVTMDDAFQAERMFTLLMGDDVEPRRNYIEKHAATVKDLDI
ncbi:MAG: hypothetical protein KAG97_04000, partial [Victivallales bacterium]|nr:hypothetical protein [Victivallales bacterium]